MSLKLLKLRCKIFFWTITGRIKKLSSRIQLTLTQGRPEKILIIFPVDEPSFRVAYYSFRNLGKESRGKIDITFIIKEQFKGLFHLSTGKIIYIKDSDAESTLYNENSIILQLGLHKFDIIADLNPKFHLGVAKIISQLNADLKIGFESDFSDWFYNIQLDISKSGIMEKGFNKINMILAQ